MMTYIDTDEMRQKTNDITSSIEKIKEIFDNIDKDFTLIKNEEYWLGPASDKVFEIQGLLKDNYEDITNSMYSLNNFINHVADEYENFDKVVKEKFDNNRYIV